MKKFIYILSFLIFASSICSSQIKPINDPEERALDIQVEINENPFSIRLSWENDTSSLKYYVYKKRKDEDSFGVPVDVIKDTAVKHYTDYDAEPGITYDYGIHDFRKEYTSYGYVSAGKINRAVHHRGRILLVIDKTLSPYLEKELNRFTKDITGDGWLVDSIHVPRSENFNSGKVRYAKKRIKERYIIENDTLRSIFLIGRVPVPYSGYMAIDGHKEHFGAWSADVFYAELNGNWTDTAEANTESDYPRNHNYPGDGKFDNNMVPSAPELESGRVDMYDLPVFKDSSGLDEVDLLKKYFYKNHQFRNGYFSYDVSSVVVNNFAEYGEVFAYSGTGNFNALMDESAINFAIDRSYIMQDTALWYYACGAGGFQSIWRGGYSVEFANLDFYSVFTMIFGSYCGDWDVDDNLLRTAIASSPSILTSVWAGRPYWNFIHMGLGENIGYSTKLTQSNYADTYETTSLYGHRGVHIALMGDPTLRMHVLEPVENIQAVQENSDINLSWNEVSEAEGYFVYRLKDFYSKAELISEGIVEETSFTDKSPLPGKNIYMVKTTAMEKTNTGYFRNTGTGQFTEITYLPEVLTEGGKAGIYPNPVKEELNIAFKLDEPQEVKIIFYDSEGKRTGKEISRYAAENYNIFTKNLKEMQLSGGVCFVKIKSSDYEIIKKFVYIK